MQNVYKNVDEYNIDEERKILIVFYDMIADMINNKKLNSIVTELFVRGKLLLSQDNILRFQKMLDWILLTFLSRKLQTKENFNKLR